MRDKFREALFNEIKGSLFEYLTAQAVARTSKLEAAFLKSLPPHYQQVLEQQDHMTRELYPKLVEFLPRWAKATAEAILVKLVAPVTKVQLTGQLVHTEAAREQGEADFFVTDASGVRAFSLKLNKKAGAVNTKSGGIKSFFVTYFDASVAAELQESFNQLVDSEFAILREELLELAGLDLNASWEAWTAAGFSELPGELPADLRERLHAFYARLAQELGLALRRIEAEAPEAFLVGLERLCGFGEKEVTQVICFHDIQGTTPEAVSVRVHQQSDVRERLREYRWRETQNIASVELALGDWVLQIRIKPMNKFTTTAIKMNCSLRF